MNFTDCCFAQWIARYNGPAGSTDETYAIAVDDSGNVYVTGRSVGSETNFDYATIKYNTLGVEQWVVRYNGPPANGYDQATTITIDDSGNVYVTGRSDGPGTGSDYATIKYNSSGDSVWVARYNGPGNSSDGANGIAIDDSGNVYVTGESLDSATYLDYTTVKYNSSGIEQWVARYNAPGNSYSPDYAKAIAVDDSGNVYVTGRSWGSGPGFDYATIKYDSSGDTLWVARYDGPGNGNDGATAIAVDRDGNVYVTGGISNIETESDYGTIKYNSLGVEQWVVRYNGIANRNDWAYGIAIDREGNVYVTGGETSGIGSSDYATVKYNSSGEEQWVARYDGPSNGSDRATAIAVDNAGYVYVTGGSYGSGDNADYATIKYSCLGIEESEKFKVKSVKLEVCPNPVVGSGIICYELPDELTTRNSQLITLKVYDLGGRLIKTLVDGEVSAGHHEIELMGGHDKPCPYKKGIYFIQLKSGGFTTTRKLIILK